MVGGQWWYLAKLWQPQRVSDAPTLPAGLVCLHGFQHHVPDVQVEAQLCRTHPEGCLSSLKWNDPGRDSGAWILLILIFGRGVTWKLVCCAFIHYHEFNFPNYLNKLLTLASLTPSLTFILPPGLQARHRHWNTPRPCLGTYGNFLLLLRYYSNLSLGTPGFPVHHLFKNVMSSVKSYLAPYAHFS